MSLKGLTGGLYRPLTDEAVQTIHDASIRILEKTGFTYESGLEDTLAMLEKAGVTVDREKTRILFPKDLITDLAAKAPERVVLYSRDGKNDLDLTEHRVLDTIASVGPGGNFMTADHTIAHMRKEYFNGNGVTDRKTRDTWVKEGAQDTWSRARKMVKEMLAEEEKSYLPKALDKKIQEKYCILL